MSTVVAIDGPAGAGKSTVAKKLAVRMGFSYVNTGNLYRALAWASARAGIDPATVSSDFLSSLQIEFRGEELFLNGTAPGSELRTPECAAGASLIAKNPAVRSFLLPVQRRAAEHQWIVMEGRDIGTVVFPDARFKFFVTATPEERARRRLAQQGEVASGATLEKVKAEIEARDHQDSTRKEAPLKAADDALLVDTTGLSIDDVVEKLAGIIRSGK